MASSSAPAGDVQFTVKNSSRPNLPDFSLAVAIDSTVADVKAKIRQGYDGHPLETSQTIIYAGKVLKGDEIRVGDFINKDIEPGVPHSLHLVVREATPTPAPRTAPSATVPTAAPSASSAGTTGAPGLAFHAGEAQFTGAPPATSVPFQGYQYPQYQTNPYMLYNPTLNPALMAAYNAALASLAQSQQQAGAEQENASGASTSSGTPGSQAEAGAGSQPEGAFMQQAPHGATQPMQMPQMLFNPYVMGAQQQQQQGQQQQQARFGPFMQMAPLPYGMYPYAPGAAYPYMVPQNPYMMPQNVLFAHPGQQQQGAPGPQFRGFNGGAPFGAMPPEHGAAAAHPVVRPRNPNVRVRMIRVNLRVALQLGVLGFILWQHMSPWRFLLMVLVGLAFYLTAMEPLQRALQRLSAALHPPPPRPGAQAERGFLRELQALLIGFFTSLLPGWNVNPEDAAAFAAAQQAEEAAARAAEAAGREHQD